MGLVVSKIKNADIFKIYTDEPEIRDRKFVGMLNAKNVDELMSKVLELKKQKVVEKISKKGIQLLDAEKRNIGKFDQVENIKINDVIAAVEKYIADIKLSRMQEKS